MSRRNRTNRRRQYGKRQHEVRERRTGLPGDDSSTRDDGWAAPESIDDSHRRDDAYDSYDGWAR